MDNISLGLDMLKDMEKEVTKTKQNLKVAQSRQKSYANRKRTHKEFKVGDRIYIIVKPKRSSIRMGTYAKITPCYRGLFKVLERMGPMAYILALPPSLEHIMYSIYLCLRNMFMTLTMLLNEL